MVGRFKKLVILDNVVLFPEQVRRLEACAHEIVDYRDKPIHPRLSSDAPAPNGEESAAPGLACEANPEYTVEERKELVRRTKDADAIVSCWTNIPDEVIADNPALRYVLFWTNIYRHRINSAYAADKNIHIDHIPDYGTEAVAEYVFAALFELARNLPRQSKDAATGSWRYEYLKTGKKRVLSEEMIDEWLLAGKTLGIVGLGRVGTRVALTARLGFGMQVAYYSRTRKREIEHLGIRYEPLDKLLSSSDIVSLHVPSDAPVNLFGQPEISRLKDRAILVNTSSGRAVDEGALLQELRTGRISAILDVYKGHPPRKELKGLSNVFFTYRAAWYTRETLKLKGDMMLDKMEAFLRHAANPA